VPSFFFAPPAYHTGSLDRQKSDTTLAVLRQAGITGATCVVDIGCGAGQTLQLVQELAPLARLIGVDADEAALASGLADPNRVWFVRAEGERLPLADGIASHVICRVAINYMHQGQALREMARVSAPGGRLVLSFISPGYALKQLAIPGGKSFREWLGSVKDLLCGMLLQLTGWQGGRESLLGKSVPYTPLGWLRRQLRGRGWRISQLNHEGWFLGLHTISWAVIISASAREGPGR
jgi:SAM-dependent methyltransferase